MAASEPLAPRKPATNDASMAPRKQAVGYGPSNERLRQIVRLELEQFMKDSLKPELQTLLEKSLAPIQAQHLHECTSEEVPCKTAASPPKHSATEDQMVGADSNGEDVEVNSIREIRVSASGSPDAPSKRMSELELIGFSHPSTKKGLQEQNSWEQIDSDEVEEAEWTQRPHTPLEGLLHNPNFSNGVCILIVMNSLFMGVQADYSLKNTSHESCFWLEAIDVSFVLVFALELGARIVVHGCSLFYSHDWMWNIFDIVVVTLPLFQLVLPLLVSSEYSHVSFTFLRIFRIVRTLRIVRVGRVVNATAELRMLLVTLLGTFRSLMWVLLILVFTTYSFGVWLTQMIADHWAQHPAESKEEHAIMQMYGSLGDTMLVLFQILTNGIDWADAMDPLARYISPYVVLIFSFYIAFAIFALLNVVTGIFLNAAQKTAEDDKRRLMVDQIRRAFVQADVDGSGQLSMNEFDDQLENHDFILYLKALELNEANARDLFHLLDNDKSGEISIAEFVQGCIRLHGPAKAIDFAIFLADYRAWAGKVEDHLKSIDTTLRDIRVVK